MIYRCIRYYRSRPAALRTLAFSFPALAAFAALAPACTRVDRYLQGGESGGPASFAEPDAASSGDAEPGLVSYCPSNQCPSGHTTCASSRFPCDVDLSRDIDNCGSCGAHCRYNPPGATSSCIDGTCAMKCNALLTADCDGIVDNGCEVTLGTNDNCSACGDKCDPAAPCMFRRDTKPACGCGANLYCPTPEPVCVDGKLDDDNCGACGNVCPTPAAGFRMRLGCVDGQCGQLKCEKDWSSCDDDLDNGCETNLTTEENCGFCGNACSPDQRCVNTGLKYECLCREGWSLCGDQCVSFVDDANHCGGCGVKCNTGSYCSYGSCVARCPIGWADCNGDPTDGCETYIDADPRNCGVCGRACDGVAGQPCVGGQCVVEPCDQGEDGGTTR